MPDFHRIVREHLRQAVLSGPREAEIVEEIAQHMGQRYERLLSFGNSESHAMATVVAELEKRDLAQELLAVESPALEPAQPGEVAGRRWWAGLWRDARYGARALRLSPGFTIVCVLSLALGIGANTAIFQLIDAVRLRTLPVKDPGNLVVIRPTDPGRSGDMTGRYSYSTNPMWQQVRSHQEGVDAFAWGTVDFNIAPGGEVRSVEGLWVSGEFFDVLGVNPLIGRVLHASDDHPGCGAPGVVISHGFWQREFGSDPQITSKTMTVEGHQFPIVGVTPASFYGLEVGRRFDVAAPLCSEPVLNGDDSMYNSRRAWWLAIMGRLKPGWTMERATAQLSAVSPSIMQETLPDAYYTPDHAKRYLALKLAAVPAATGLSNLRRNYETPLWLLLAIAGLVLLIACGNLANLMLARAGAREREIAVRLALGATRRQLIRQLLTESLLLGLAGAAIGVGLARLLSQLLIDYLNGDAGRLFVALPMDWRVLGFTTLLALLTCILFGLAPAMKATSAAPARVMSLAGRGLTASRERFSLRRALVVTQVALSLVLVVTALLFVRTLHNILQIDAGFQRDGILVMDVDYTRLQLPNGQRMPFAESLLDRIRALPGLENVAETDVLPLGGSYWNDDLLIDGKLFGSSVDMSHISPGYLRTIGTPLLAGRDFDQRDSPTSPRVAIVNQQFASKVLHTENPIGRTFQILVSPKEPRVDYQIVGLVKNTKYQNLREDFPPIAYFPQLQAEKPNPGISVIVRSSLPLEPLLASLRKAIADANPTISIDFRVLENEVKGSLLRERLMATLSGFFGILAVILATVGLYGVVAYMVVRRTNEIGIRIALGATPARILIMIVRESAILLGIGIFIGALLAMVASKTAATMLFGLTPQDPWTLALAALLLSAVAVSATLFPARRAAHLEPTVALRED